MEWLKNEKELFQFLSDMKRKNQVAMKIKSNLLHLQTMRKHS